jgi:hypothetical protein
MGRFGHDRRIKSVLMPSSNGKFEGKLRIERAKTLALRIKEKSLESAADLVKSKVPRLSMEVDSELEIPEYMLEALPAQSVEPVF